MNSFDPTLSIGDVYQDGYTDGYQDEMDSPVLRPKRLHLRITPSPPPMVTEIKASLGDAVLIRFMTDGRDPNIANFEADREFSDRSEVDDDDSDGAGNEAGIEPDIEDADIEPADDSRDNANAKVNTQAVTETPRQTEQVDTTEVRARAAADADSRQILPSIASLTDTSLTALPALLRPIPPRQKSPIPATNQRELIMEDSDEDQYMTSPSNIHTSKEQHNGETTDTTHIRDEAFTKSLDAEMAEQGPPRRDPKPQPSSSQRETSTITAATQSQQEEYIGLAQKALACTTMSRQNSRNKDPTKNDSSDEKSGETKNTTDFTDSTNITDIRDIKDSTETDSKDFNPPDDIKDSINVKTFPAPPRPIDRAERLERTPLPGSRIERSSSTSSRTSQFRPSPYNRPDQQIRTVYAAASAATSPADQSPSYSYTSPSNSGHTPLSHVSAASTLTPASYAASNQPSPAYSSPGTTHQHQLSPRRAPTLEHTRPPPLLPILQMQQQQQQSQSPSAYTSPPPTNFENCKLSPIATDALAHATRSGNDAPTFDRGMSSATSLATPLPSIALYIKTRQKIEGSPLLPHPSPNLQLPPITSPPPPMGKYGSSRDIRDIRDANPSPASTTSRQQTLPPLQQHLRHPLPTSSNVHASSSQRSPLPRLPSSSNRPLISAAGVRGGSSESMHKRHLDILPVYQKAMHPQLAPMDPGMQAQARHSQSQGQGQGLVSSPVKSRATNKSPSAPASSAPSTPVGSYKCTVEGCTAAPFVTQYLLNSHATVHSVDRPHYCPIADCPRSKPGNGFKRKNEMIRHGLVHKSPGYVCPYCPDREHKYPRPDNLLRHVRAHHKDKSKDDAELRDVLAQRPDGPSRGRRRRN